MQERLEKLNEFLQVGRVPLFARRSALAPSQRLATPIRRLPVRRNAPQRASANVRSGWLAQIVVEDAEYSGTRMTKGFLKISLGENW